MLSKIFESLSSPGGGLTWTQLAGATIFVITVAIMWRQVTFFIMREA